MKGGPLAVGNSLIRQYLAQGQARLHTEAIVVAASDLRQTYSALNAGSKTNVTAIVEDAVRITASAATGISHTTGTDDFTAIASNSPTGGYLAWALDESAYGPTLRLSKVQLYLDPQRNTANPPFDGTFRLHFYRIANAYRKSSTDLWVLSRVATSVSVKASSIAAAGLVDFALASSAFGETPGHTVLDALFIPNYSSGPALIDGTVLNNHSRVIVVQLVAENGPSGNTNYSWKYNSATSNPETVANKGVLYWKSGTTPTSSTWGSAGAGLANRQVTDLTGIPRITFTVSSYSATGSLGFTGGSQMDLGASPTGTVEFRVTAEVPTGCTGTAYARVNSGDPWTVVKDGDTPTDAGLASSRTYEMKYDFAADSTLSATPTLRLLGIVDRTLLDLSEIATWTAPLESVDYLTGEVKMAEAECRLNLTGQRDYRDDVTTLLASNGWNTIELRTHAYHPNLARSQWGYLDLWSLDNADVDTAEAVLTCVSLLSKLKGKYPASAGTLYGYLLKSTASDWTSGLAHTGDFYQELSPATQSTSSVTWTVSAGATEYAYMITPASLPNLGRWTSGDWSIAVNLTSGDSNIKLAARLLRYNSAKALQQTLPALPYGTGEEVTASTGAHTITFGAIEWTAGAASDRLVIELRARNTDGGSSHAITFETGTVATETRPPWIPTASVTPQQFSAVSPASAIATWVDSVIGLPARYRGAFSDRAQWLVSKAVMDVDGQREAERISYLDGLAIIASQGQIKQVNLWGPRGSMVAAFPMETYAVGGVTMGFAARLPEYQAGYGYETNIPNDFAGTFRARHTAAFTAFGRAKIDEPVPELEHDIAKYILDPGLAGEIVRTIVVDQGCGDIRITFTPLVGHPWIEIGDVVAVETDRIAFKNPVTAEAVRGVLWALCTVLERSGDYLRPTFVGKVRGMGDLFVTSDSLTKRQPYEGPRVTCNVSEDPSNVQNALVVLRSQPTGATIYYKYHATSEAAPDRDQRQLWSTYSSQITLLRDTSSDKLLSAFAVYNGFSGAVQDFRIAPSPASTIGSLVGSESGTTVTAVASQVGQSVRGIRWYMRKHATNYPTSDGTTTGDLDETYYVNEKPVDTALGGGLTQAHTGVVYGAGDKCKVIAVPIDYNRRAGTRKTLDYAYAGSTTPRLTAATWTLNTSTAGATRTVDFAWTPSGVSDVTHDLLIYTNDGIKARTVIKTEVSPNSTTSATNISTGYVTGTGYPQRTLVYEYEIVAGSTVVAAGYFSPTDGDTFYIGDGTLAT